MNDRKPRRRQIGTVTSDAMDKTVAVRVDWLYVVPKYGKRIRRHTTYYAHDEANEAHVGDEVEIVATRPLSRLKRWRVVRVIRTSETAAVQHEAPVDVEADTAEVLAAAAPEPAADAPAPEGAAAEPAPGPDSEADSVSEGDQA